jgi:hypothetical protein
MSRGGLPAGFGFGQRTLGRRRQWLAIGRLVTHRPVS